MKRALLLLVLTACGNAAAPDFAAGGVGAPPPAGPRLEVDAPVTFGLTFRNLRADGELLAVDVESTGSFAGVYGIALRLNLEGAKFVRAEAAASWPIVRAQASALVFSAQGLGGERTVPIGRLATIWFRPAAASGRVALDPLRSALVAEDGERRTLSVGAARWVR